MSGVGELEIRVRYMVYPSPRALPSEWARLYELARDACAGSYAPYSGFHVGAAVELDGGGVVLGANQENAAYPSGLCAERVALFSAGAARPGVGIRRVAIAARHGEEEVRAPVCPCGACRQVLLEYAQRVEWRVGILMGSSRECWLAHDARDLLPLSFSSMGDSREGA